MAPDIRVVVPADNRLPQSRRTLAGLAAQEDLDHGPPVSICCAPQTLVPASLSLVYNVEYYRGVAEEFGEEDPLVERFEMALAA